MYGFRITHCVRAIVMFAIVAGVDAWWMMQANTTLSRVLFGAVGAVCFFVLFNMTIWLVSRLRGTRRIIVGPRTLKSPTGVLGAHQDVEIAYADMKDVVAKGGGEKGKLKIKHGNGVLEIDRLMLANDHEFDELVGAVRKRVAKDR